MSEDEIERAPRRTRILWATAAPVFAVLLSAIALLFNHHFYYVDDSESSAFGQYYEIGRKILQFDWSIVNPRVWQSGDLLAETSWGFFSPVLWIVGLTSHLAINAAAFLAVVKLSFIATAALGVYLLARSLGARAPWATLIGALVPLGGATVFLDSASWANGLMSWSLLPLAWWLSRRAVHRRGSILLAIGSGFLLLGINYVHATLMFATVLVALLVEAARTRERERIVRALVVGASSFFIVVIIYLPALLTAPVSGRTGSITNTGLLTVSLSNLAGSATGTGASSIDFFGDLTPSAPVTYISWLLPLFAFVQWRRLAPLLGQSLSILAVLLVGLLIALGPSDVGPLRFPIRVMPFITLAVLLALSVGMSKARATLPSRARFWAAMVLVLVSAYFTFAASPELILWVAPVAIVELAGVGLIYLVLSGRAPRLTALLPGGQRVVAAVAVAFVATAGIGIIQHAAAPASPLREYSIPAAVSKLSDQLPETVGDTIVVGTIPGVVSDPGIWKDVLTGNIWYVDPDAHVQNAYSTVYYPPYNRLACMSYNGSTCAGLLSTLFARQPQTHRIVADLIGVSSIAVMKNTVVKAEWSQVPKGWHVAQDDREVRLIVRDHPIPPAGNVAWTSHGVSVTTLHEDDMGVTFRVDEVPSNGGEVALSRIPWPGYQVSGAQLAASPVDRFLLGIDLTGTKPGQVVRVSFHSPGEVLQIISAILLLVILTGGTVMLRRARSSGDRLSVWIAGSFPQRASARARSQVRM